MDYRKSHNFDKNVIAQNLAGFGDHDFSDDDSSGDSFGGGHVSEEEDSEEEEVELTELEKESLSAQFGVGGKRPSRALEQIMMGMDINDDKDFPLIVPSDKPDDPRTRRKAQEDSDDDKEDDTLSQMMKGSKTHSLNEKSGYPPWEGNIDDIIKKPKHGGMPIPGTHNKILSPKGRTSGNSSVRIRRGKRSEMAKSSSEAHRSNHHNPSTTSGGAIPVSPGRPRHASMQHRTQSATDVNSTKPRNLSMQHRTGSMSEERPDDALNRVSGHGPSRRLGHAPRTDHHSGDEKPDDPIPSGSGHGRRRSGRPKEHHNGEDDHEKPDDPIPGGSGHGRRRNTRRKEHHTGEDDHEKPDDPIPRGSGHGRRRNTRPADHPEDDHDKPDDPLPRGSGHGRRRQAAAARRTPGTPTRQASAARRVKQGEPNTTKLSDSSNAGLKW